MTLPAMRVADRIPRLRAALDAAECDALLVTHLTNVRYLTGFTGSAATLLVSSDRSLLVSDGRYAAQAEEQLSQCGVDAEIEIGPLEHQKSRLAVAGKENARIGLEAATVSWGSQRSYTALFDSSQVVATEGLVEQLRRVKDAGEIARIEEACRIADAAFAEVKHILTDEPSEKEFAIELDFAMRRMGAADVSFETIVASGPNGAKPHARPSERLVGSGELVVVDFGALVDGYHSDMTRTVCVGDPGRKAMDVFELVVEVQAAGVNAVRAGAGARDVDSACRDVITSAGFGDAFVHGTGHGVGLDIHEFPILGATATATLAAGFVVTVEPGVYLPGELGVRIEDSVVVTDDGSRRLTNAPKDLGID